MIMGVAKWAKGLGDLGRLVRNRVLPHDPSRRRDADTIGSECDCDLAEWDPVATIDRPSPHSEASAAVTVRPPWMPNGRTGADGCETRTAKALAAGGLRSPIRKAISVNVKGPGQRGGKPLDLAVAQPIPHHTGNPASRPIAVFA